MESTIKPALYIVATPIGNLSDITLRAIEILKQVEVIFAEDTRTTSVLLEKYQINTKLISYHKFSDNKKTELVLEYLNNSKPVALVSDAGTPLISDPGGYLVEKARKEGFEVVPIVGACALIALLSSIARLDEDFKFIGFISRNKNQIIDTVKQNRFENLIFYESPKRALSTLEIIKEINPNKKIALARELTKKFEEIKTDSVSNLIEYYKTNPLKGEIVIMLHKDRKDELKESGRVEINLDYNIEKLKKLNLKDKQIASIISTLFEVNKNNVYKRCIELS